MTRGTKNSMRKMAVTGLTLIGMFMASLGTVGCDENSLNQMGQAFTTGNADAMQLASSNFVTDKAESVSRIFHTGPPRR